ncbi:hypothetical protein BpHYR1_000746 [Brachionus plicatilis]|uniref:Uncharacterized protein n=1 Tax=Brachionus plicatilis TaxID=10195 RepID=A0A3M7S2V6_BRAPC|nr:hypothetical protein BpHYR1_000746 [Brachionus plicatilis]
MLLSFLFLEIIIDVPKLNSLNNFILVSDRRIKLQSIKKRFRVLNHELNGNAQIELNELLNCLCVEG